MYNYQLGYNGYNGYNQFGYNNPAPTIPDQQFQYVDNIDVVRATNARLDGQPTFFAKTDKSEVYCKGLNPQTGASYISTYKLVDCTKPVENDVSSTLTQIQSEITELKNMILEFTTAPSKGGDVR